MGSAAQGLVRQDWAVRGGAAVEGALRVRHLLDEQRYSGDQPGYGHDREDRAEVEVARGQFRD